MSEREYRAVIVGLTGIGAKRPVEEEGLPVYGAMPMSHASAYYRCPQTRLTAVCDLREEALDSFRENWNDVWPEMRYYVDYREMFEAENPELVSVATSDHLHADIVVAAAERGTPAILCEKPLATTLRRRRPNDCRGRSERDHSFSGSLPQVVPTVPQGA